MPAISTRSVRLSGPVRIGRSTAGNAIKGTNAMFVLASPIAKTATPRTMAKVPNAAAIHPRLAATSNRIAEDSRNAAVSPSHSGRTRRRFASLLLMVVVGRV
ncbi:hypothetical protein GCM10009529_12950 [Micropruina glycogenica]